MTTIFYIYTKFKNQHESLPSDKLHQTLSVLCISEKKTLTHIYTHTSKVANTSVWLGLDQQTPFGSVSIILAQFPELRGMQPMQVSVLVHQNDFKLVEFH